MMKQLRHAALAAAMMTGASTVAAQTFDTVGTRAAGMGGAFVAVADDASAAYWNPAGFASGNFFTMVVDRTTGTRNPGGPGGASARSGTLLALGMPALALSYYRLRTTVLSPGPLPTAGLSDSRESIGAGRVRLDTLITHHTGATVLQSIAPGVAVGATLKLVRGVAASAVVPDGDRGALLDAPSELDGRGTTRFDADLGVMAGAGRVKAGLTVRNLLEPAFATPGGMSRLSLRRQARAGVAVTLAEGWAVAADLDLTRATGPAGPVRHLAVGTEGRLGRRAFVRGGLSVNTADGRRPAVAAGASYAVSGSVLLDAQATGGSNWAERGWGVAARFVY